MGRLIDLNRGKIELTGELTQHNSRIIQLKIESVLTQNNQLIIDLSQLKKLDVSGVFMLYIIKNTAPPSLKKIYIISNSGNLNVFNAISLSGLQNFVTAV